MINRSGIKCIENNNNTIDIKKINKNNDNYNIVNENIFVNENINNFDKK